MVEFMDQFFYNNRISWNSCTHCYFISLQLVSFIKHNFFLFSPPRQSPFHHLSIRYSREMAGDKLLIGVDRGVDLGVDPADRRPAGLVSLWLNTFSFPSGTKNQSPIYDYSSTVLFHMASLFSTYIKRGRHSCSLSLNKIRR